MNILFITFVCRIYGFCDTEIVHIRALSIFGYFLLVYFPLVFINMLRTRSNYIGMYVYAIMNTNIGTTI